MHKGSCLCKAVSFEVEGQLPAVSACHCTICRKHTGHFEAGIDVDKSRVKINGANNVTWYKSSEKADVGFVQLAVAFYSLSHLMQIGSAFQWAHLMDRRIRNWNDISSLVKRETTMKSTTAHNNINFILERRALNESTQLLCGDFHFSKSRYRTCSLRRDVTEDAGFRKNSKRLSWC